MGGHVMDAEREKEIYEACVEFAQELTQEFNSDGGEVSWSEFTGANRTEANMHTMGDDGQEEPTDG